MKFFPIPILSVLLFMACKTKNSQSAELSTGKIDSTSAAPHYPFTEYIAKQLAYVDSMPLALERIIRKEDKTLDSSIVEKTALHQAVAPFIAINPNDKKWHDAFREESFEDLSVESVTFTLTALDEKLPIRQVDVLLQPVTKAVKTVIIKRSYTSGDTSFFQNLLWVHNLRCQLAESYSVGNNAPIMKVTEYIWDRPVQSSVVR